MRLGTIGNGGEDITIQQPIFKNAHHDADTTIDYAFLEWAFA